jgi:hypothetical protein
MSALTSLVGSLGGAYMLDRDTLSAGEQLGYQPWPFYYGGRGGVLGDVDADVVAAAMVFFPPDRLRRAWEKAAQIAPPATTAARYADCCHQWGRAHLADVVSLDRLCELAGRVVSAASPAAAPLFAGWRALDWPAEPAARAAHLLMALRELRGARHTVAVLGTGLTPLEAIVAGSGGAPNATFLGWSEPFPDPAPLHQRRQDAEQLTDQLSEPDYAVLSAAERAEFEQILAGAAGRAR